ncbi:MAG: DUF2950 domain-containing protein [Nitrospirae bacterium]|nr:MAG: DUF2950 domain-containing protein [Nitrospirota bacterium]
MCVEGTMVNRILCAVALLAMAPVALAATAVQKGFASPEEGISALVEAVRANDEPALRAVLGPRGGKLISSGDAVADQHRREAFLKAYDDANKLVHDGDARVTLAIGRDEWPMPIPLVKSGGGWRFDTRKGEQEILARRIGRNELSAIQVCLAILDAEREYAALDVDGDGIPEYARKFVSAPGKRDGLYWPTQGDERQSPLGPLLAAATKEGYPGSNAGPLAPYHGYFYKILIRQGKHAPGGAYNYLVKGRMIGGIAVLAYPARYGASGVMSFAVNHDGVVYEKDLGKDTASIASRVKAFDPDASWKRP